MENINPGLNSLAVPLASLKLDSDNARNHEVVSLDAIKSSLKEFGQQKPIVVLKDGTIIAGNGTYQAAKALGWAKLAVVRFDDLKKARAYAIADNRTAELSTWNNDALARQIDEISQQYDGWTPEMVGFTEAEVMQIIASAQASEVIDNTPTETSDGPSNAPPATLNTEPSHVRMVQLFLDDKTQPAFADCVRKLSARYGTATVTDTVLRAVQELASNDGKTTPSQ